MHIVLKNDENKLKEVNLGYNFIFLLFLLTGFLIIPFAFYVLYKKQYKEMLTAYVLLYIVNIVIATAMYNSDNFNVVLLMLNSIILFTSLYLFPKYINIWLSKRLAKDGYKPVPENSEMVNKVFQEHVENNTIFGSIFRF